MRTDYILTLALIPGVGRATIKKIIDASLQPDLYSFNKSSEQDLRSIFELLQFIRRKYVKTLHFDNFKKYYEEALKKLELSRNEGVHVINITEDYYPPKLKSLNDPPVLLHIKGNIDVLKKPKAIAVIGTREPTNIGRKISEYIGKALAQLDIVVVSGLAKGCDAYAHLGCLDAHGSTIAVLAHGLHMVYPPEHKELASRILESGGCLVSEYVFGTPPHKNYFVQRDRIQSGLSDAIIVVETGVKGGTMHTVNFALKQKRPIGVCVSIDEAWKTHEKAQGNLKLIREEKAFPLNRNNLGQFIKLVYK